MVLNVINHPYEFDMKNLCTIFFPHEKIKMQGVEDIIITTQKNGLCLTVDAVVYDKRLCRSYNLKSNDDEATAMSALFYGVLSDLLGFKPPWGILFGVRPAKLMHRFSQEMGEERAHSYFVNTFLTTPSKASLALEVMKHENDTISLSSSNSFSLYVSIPFCPTRCSYCSFVSHSIERTAVLVEPYVKLLCRELEDIAKIAKALSLRLETVYFGGGTPTTLEPKLLNQIFKTIEDNFDLSTLREYTVEAGRPDTVTTEKLNTIKNAGVTRISINPQSFNDEVLDAIGRKHTSRMTLDAYELAVKCGFDNINMDFIAGLPKDSLPSFKNSIDTAVNLGAQSVTVHTLALKSGAYMVTRDSTFDLTARLTTADMVDYSYEKLKASGYYPYYMYRQSKSVGNLENVGWCKQGRDCLYNVFMMDETHSVFSAGAGAVTRLKAYNSGKIERIYNFKYPYEYIDRFEEISKRKNNIFDFYEKYK